MFEQYTPPEPPAHLHKTGREAWAELCEEFRLKDRDDLRLLGLAAEALDREAQARRAIRDNGLTWVDRLGNVRPRPEVTIETKARAQAAHIIGQLQRSFVQMQRLEMAEERHEALREREQADSERRRDRRGGGVRRNG